MRFHLLASFRARTLLQSTLQLNDWSETLNDQQLVSALAQLQVHYQKANSITTQSGAEEVQEGLVATNYANQSEFVAYDILLHADDPRAVRFVLHELPLGAHIGMLTLLFTHPIPIFVASFSSKFLNKRADLNP